MMLLMFIFFFQNAVFASTPVSSSKISYDLQGGSCEDFNDHVKNRGLKDSDGNTHTNTLGWTLCKFSSIVDESIKVIRTEINSKVCMKMDLAQAKFISDYTVIIMRWDHKGREITPECTQELARNEAAVRSHEGQHVADCNSILEESKKTWSNNKHEIEVCKPRGTAEQSVMDLLQSKVRDELQDQLSRMSKEMEYRTRETHERIGYGTSGIDCRKCG